ncbi:hypothetical protein ACLI1A_02680 [Flavobacterium sp. RHBU_3]|uniref:hypothetical protein n=1 Tax=Flavobacterium sp. RHBU_3 TaxID=3391184 RepID=UPI003984D9C4
MNTEKPIFGDNQVIITSAVLTVWLISHYFNGMMMNLLFCWFIILPTLVVHIISLFTTIRSAFVNLRATRLKLFCHGFVLLLALGIRVKESDLFKSERVLTAIKSDDHYYETLTLRKDGTTEIYGTGLTGNTDTYNGSYKVKGNLIIFTNKPFETKVYFPDTLYWDKKQKTLFTSKDSLGNFITKRSFLNYYKIMN